MARGPCVPSKPGPFPASHWKEAQGGSCRGLGLRFCSRCGGHGGVVGRGWAFQAYSLSPSSVLLRAAPSPGPPALCWPCLQPPDSVPAGQRAGVGGQEPPAFRWVGLPPRASTCRWPRDMTSPWSHHLPADPRYSSWSRWRSRVQVGPERTLTWANAVAASAHSSPTRSMDWKPAQWAFCLMCLLWLLSREGSGLGAVF